MTYDVDKKAAGGERIDVVEIEQVACSLTFGAGLCYATGTKCVNTWESCKAPDVFADTVKTLRFCTPVSKLPMGLGLIPFIAKDGVNFDPADLTPEDGVGKIASGSVRFVDGPHDDVGLDPYVGTRGFNMLERGTLWPRLRARWPSWQGRVLHWYTGYLHDNFSLANLQRRTYQVEGISGFGGARGVEVKFKDPLKLGDDKRAVWPPKSTGTLAAAIASAGAVTTMEIATSTPTEYDLEDYEAIGVVNLKGELFQYTAYTIVTGGIRLTGVTRDPPAPYSCTKSEHEVGDEVQKCAWFDTKTAPEILGPILIRGADLDPAWVPYTTTWQDLYDTWLGSATLTRLVCEPQGVTSLCSEILLESSGWGLWWDDLNAVVGYEVFRPAALGEVVQVITDGGNVVAGKVDLSDDEDRLLNWVAIRYGQADPTLDAEEVSNYSRATLSIDPGSRSSREVGSYRQREIYARWHAKSTAFTVGKIGDRLVAARAAVPFIVTFEVMRKDDGLQTGQFIDLQTAGGLGMFGETATLRCRVTKADYGKDFVKYTARQDFVSTRYGLIAPSALAGVTWATATPEQRLAYVFIADANGLMPDGSEGKRIF
jgi:hypothetical protein